MSAAREAVLGKVRAALGPSPEVPDVPRDYVRAGGRDGAGSDAVVALFAERVADYEATVHHAGAGELPALLQRLTEEERVVCAPATAELLGLPAGGQQSRIGGQGHHSATVAPVVDDGALDTAALDGFGAVVSGCAVAIAETGTIVLDGGPDSGRRAISLIPDHHVCVVRADQVVASVPDGIAALRPAVDAGRPLTLISGPSATSDIELERVEGVHGPRRLDVVIVDPA